MGNTEDQNDAQPEDMGEPEEEMSLFRELWLFMKEQKAWWITPIVVILVVFGALILLAEGSAAAPFIYALF